MKEKQERIRKVLAALAEESAKDTPIVVEGKKDVEALRGFDVEGVVITVKTGGKSYLEVVTEIENSGVENIVLFLDFDRRGVEGTKLLKRHFEQAKIKVDLSYWNTLKTLIGKELQCVEGLPVYMKNLSIKTGVLTI